MARLCRRICLLRERGDPREADRLCAAELTAVLDALRVATGETMDAMHARFEQVMAIEEERVANAAVLAELLAPLLGAPRVAEPLPAPERSANSESMAPAPPRPATPDHAPPANIADFIDEMLAQERAAPPTRRRVS